MANETGPYLQVAVLCEKVLQEASGVLSLIRIIDRITHTSMGPGVLEEMPVVPINVFAVVSLKSGSARGRHTLTLRPEDPSGMKLPEVSQSILFEGEDRGVNFVANIALQAKYEGLYWFDVLLDGQVWTRMPLRVMYQQVSLGTPPPAPGS
ncbi:MAG: hypothetical protein HY675_11185 [Chloroflexi bacterium]|nr:hypothetical protein [Chloroflexota bacterium]